MLFASGAAALAHQTLWTRRLVDLLGAGPETFSRVIGAFFVGLALGAAWAAWRPAAPGRAWRRVVWAEGFVAVAALVPLLVVETLTQPGTPAWATGDVARLVWPLVLVGPPAFALGIVFPAVAGVIPAARRVAGMPRLYAWNTAGGLFGVALVFFVGLPEFGPMATGLAACGTNLLVAVVAMRCQRATRSGADERDGAARSEGAHLRGTGGSPVSWLLAFWSGFAVLALEVTVQHQVTQVTINSHFSAAGVLAFVLAGLALGSFLVGCGRITLIQGILWAALGCFVQPLVFLAMQPGLRNIPYEWAPMAYFGRLAVLGAVAVVPLFVGVGLLFPLLLRGAAGAGSGEGVAPAPSVLARLLAWNGLGGWVGAEVAQGLLMPGFGLWRTVAVIGLGYGVLGVPGLVRAKWAGGMVPGRWPSWGLGLLVAGAGVGGFVAGGRLPQVSPEPGDRLVEVAVGREGVVATIQGGPEDWRIVFNNTYTLGGSLAVAHQERQALIPLLLHARAERVALLGLATGSTAAGAARVPGVQRIEAFELSPLVAGMAREHFGAWNRNVLEDARLAMILGDARIEVGRTAGGYDVVVGDLFLPWRTGEGRLYSREHFEGVRRALRPDGLFCQWLPLFQLTRPQFEAIVRTLHQVFPGVFLVRGDFYADQPIVGVVAFADGRGIEGLDWSGIAEACSSMRDAVQGTRDALMRHAEGLAMCLLGPLPPPPPGPINTLANAWLEWDAGRNVVGLRSPWFVGVPWAEYARDAHRAAMSRIPGPFQGAHDAGQFFLTLEVASVAGGPVFENLRAQVADRLPEALRRDAGADGSRWPGRVKPGLP